jgi:hypothetical protein
MEHATTGNNASSAPAALRAAREFGRRTGTARVYVTRSATGQLVCTATRPSTQPRLDSRLRRLDRIEREMGGKR